MDKIARGRRAQEWELFIDVKTKHCGGSGENIQRKHKIKKAKERNRKWKAIFGRITRADVSMSWIFSIILKEHRRGTIVAVWGMPRSTNRYSGTKTG